VVWTSAVPARCTILPQVGDDSAATEMPQGDHRVGQALECVVQLTDTLEAPQQATELIFPGEHALNGAKAFFEECGIEQGLAVGPAVVDAVQADGAAAQGEAGSASDRHYARQGLAQQRRFVAVARSGHERRDHIAVAVTEGDDLVALDLLVAIETKTVAAFLGGGGRAVAVNDLGVE
jgi:hypothetical protein